MRVSRILVSILICAAAPFAQAADAGVKQPVFLLCPHKEKMSAWSIFLLLDKSDPGKVLALGLEKLKRVNSIDLKKYEAVVEAQKDAKTEREELGLLQAGNFASGMLEVEKDNALDIQVAAQSDGSLRLMVSLRISADLRFVIGGKERAKRDVVLRYDKARKTWAAYADTLHDAEGAKVALPNPKMMTGIVFPVTGTGIYQVVGDVEGIGAVQLLDRAP